MRKNQDKYVESFKRLYSTSYILKMSLLTFLVIFILDDSNVFSKIIQSKTGVILSTITLSVFIIKMYEIKILKLLELRTANYIDMFIEVLKNGIIVYALYCTLMKFEYYKIIISLILILIFCLVELFRNIFVNKSYSMTESTNVYDLKDLFEGKIPDKLDFALLSERDVNYDLIGRDKFISDLQNIIINCRPNDKFVIALEGAWGCGKTTILNNLKERIYDENIILIDDFDPWAYEDEKSLFRGMFDLIMKKLELNFSIGKINHFFNMYLDILFYSSKYQKPYSILKNYYYSYNEINRLREIINNYLKNSNKRILFIIDNIERSEKENIIFLFKLVNNILNFDNTIYLLSFDDEKLQKIFKEDLNIDYSYIKKIIQLEVKVPKIDENIFINVTTTCLKNLFKLYGICDISKSEMEIIGRSVNDLRDLKTYINSAVTFQYKTNRYLNCVDVFLLNILEKEAPELYGEIKNNKKFFASEDIYIDENIFTFDTQKFNQEGKAFFDNFFKNVNFKHKDILVELFPYVNSYLQNKDLRDVYYYTGKHKESIIKKRIYNAKYFDLYFTHKKNDFTVITSSVENFIESINTSDDIANVESNYEEMILSWDTSFQEELFEILEMNLDKVIDSRKTFLLKIIYKNASKYDDSPGFPGTNALSRAEMIMSRLIVEMEDDELKKFKNELKQDNYSKLYLISELIRHIKSEKEFDDKATSIVTQLEAVLYEIVKGIISNNINILDDKNYSYKNIWGMYHCIKDNEDLRKNYVASILNEKTVFRFLNDALSISIGNQYGYMIQDSTINSFSEREKINSIINNIERTITQDEMLLLNIFQNSNSIDNAYHLDYYKRFDV